MIPTLALREKAMQLLAADAATLAPAALANKMVLIMDPFTPGEDLDILSLTQATFDGSTPLDVGVGAQPEGLDPATSDSIISLKPPAGGFRWETTGVTNLPQTIYGYALLDNALAVGLASDLLAEPVLLSAVNQIVLLTNPSLRQNAGSIT